MISRFSNSFLFFLPLINSFPSFFFYFFIAFKSNYDGKKKLSSYIRTRVLKSFHIAFILFLELRTAGNIKKKTSNYKKKIKNCLENPHKQYRYHTLQMQHFFLNLYKQIFIHINIHVHVLISFRRSNPTAKCMLV